MIRSWRPSPTSAARGSKRATSGSRPATSAADTYGGFETMRSNERDGARSGADVEHVRLVEARQMLETALDQDLGLGPGNQDVRANAKTKAPEPPLAQDVGQGLASIAPFHVAGEAPLLLGFEHALRTSEELRARERERLGV